MLFRKSLFVAAGVLAFAPTAVLVAATPASAVTVPNFYACTSQKSHLCKQTNGPHVNGIPNVCFHVNYPISSGSSTKICSYWQS